MEVLIDSVTKDAYITQLVLKGSEPTGFWFEIYQVFAPQGRIVRRCTLDSGKTKPTREQAEADGQDAFKRLTCPNETPAAA